MDRHPIKLRPNSKGGNYAVMISKDNYAFFMKKKQAEGFIKQLEEQPTAKPKALK